MEIIDTNLEQLRRQVDQKAKNKEPVVVRGKDIEFNRKVLEMKKVNTLILSHKNKKDKLKERDSGLNQVLCKLARDNNITLALDFTEILIENKLEKAKMLARLKQNIKLIKKFKNNLAVINKPKDSISLASLFRVLGSSTQLASQASKNQY